MEIKTVNRQTATRYTRETIELTYATGSATFNYQYGSRHIFERIVAASWLREGSLFAYDQARLALDGPELLGIELGYTGYELERRARKLDRLWQEMIEQKSITAVEYQAIVHRQYLTSFLIPRIPTDTYYVYLLSVRPDAHREGIGRTLMTAAIERAQRARHTAVHLDVFSDNPAVGFYRAMGFEILAKTTVPIPSDHGVPMELRMELQLAG